MSITIEKAREYLDLLEIIPDNPELILTELFHPEEKNQTSVMNFLYNVKIDNLHIDDFIRAYMKDIAGLKMPEISLWYYSGCITVMMKPMPGCKQEQFAEPDEILVIDIKKHIFKKENKNIGYYQKMMNFEHVLILKELPEEWTKESDFTLTGRLRIFRKKASEKKDFLSKIGCFFECMLLNKKEIQQTISRRRENIEATNRLRTRSYEEKLELQKIYKKNAPGHIKTIKAKQQVLANYLVSIGYKEEENAT